MPILEVSLSRAHKIAERLKDRVKEAIAAVDAAATPVAFSTRPALVGLEAQGQLALNLAVLATNYVNAGVLVRGAISRENHARGIDHMLGKLESLNKLIAMYKQMAVHAKADGHLPCEVAGYVPEQNAYSGFGLRVNTVREPAIAEQINRTLAGLQREAIQLSDAISEANAPRVKLELPEEIIAEVTGAA